MITIEDGVAEGGIGSMVLEILNDYKINIQVDRMALRFNDGYPQVYTNRKIIHIEEGLILDRLNDLL